MVIRPPKIAQNAQYLFPKPAGSRNIMKSISCADPELEIALSGANAKCGVGSYSNYERFSICQLALEMGFEIIHIKVSSTVDVRNGLANEMMHVLPAIQHINSQGIKHQALSRVVVGALAILDFPAEQNIDRLKRREVSI